MESHCFIELKSKEPKFQASASCPLLSSQELKSPEVLAVSIKIQEEIKTDVDKINQREEKNETKVASKASSIEINNQANADQQSTRKRRQNVAMSSLMNNQPNNNSKLNQIPKVEIKETNRMQSNQSSLTTTNNNYIPIMKNTIQNNMSSTQTGLNSNNMPTISSFPSLSNPSYSSNNENNFLKNTFINNNNTMNNLNFLQQQQQNQQQHQHQQPSFFPSASARQLNQSNHNPSNILLFNEMNQMNPQRFNQSSNSMMSFNNPGGFPNFLPHTNFPSNLNDQVNTKEKINQLNSKFQIQQQTQNQQYHQANNVQNQQIGKFSKFIV